MNPKEESTNHEYQIRPSIGKSFPITAVREIINEVLLQVLDGMLVFRMMKYDFSIKSYFQQVKNMPAKR